jgi:HEAT repeat protein
VANPRPVSANEAQWFLRARKDGDVKMLIEALRNPELRPVAVGRLGELRVEAATPKILPLLDARSDPLRTAAARALGRLQAEEAGGKLTDLARNDSAPAVRSWAIYALGCIGVDRLDNPVVQLAADPSDMVRLPAIAALVASPSKDVAEKGERLRSSEHRRLRRAVDRIITKIEEARETPPYTDRT